MHDHLTKDNSKKLFFSIALTGMILFLSLVAVYGWAIWRCYPIRPN